MTYLIYVAAFGAAATAFLWLRDMRIFWRTGAAGYRRAAYIGTACTALSLTGCLLTARGWEMIGLGVVLLALYLQGRTERGQVWHDEGAFERCTGCVRRRDDKGSG